MPHPDFGEGVTALVVTKEGEQLVDDDIHRALEPRLAKLRLPKRIFLVPELPRNTMGKVQKNLPRKAYKDAFADQHAPRPS